MKVYIAGKVTGLPIHETTLKFGEAQMRIIKLGYMPVNPLEVVNDWHAPWNIAMRKCIAALMECDIIVTLPDCDTSPGAKLEIELAYKLNIKIFKIQELPYKMNLCQ
jgi:hypothetical protein